LVILSLITGSLISDLKVPIFGRLKLSTKQATDQLPSLPQVLIQILDEIHGDGADYQSIASIIRQDPAVTSRLIDVANSSYFGRASECDSIERALLFLGIDAVKNIVITTAIKQFFNHFNQQHHQFLKHFWRRSLISANFAQVLATLTSYHAPDEAYLCGLLTNVGQLMLLTEHDQVYLELESRSDEDSQLIAAETQQFELSHAELGANLVDSWQLTGFMGDAVRFHHESADQIQDAHHLVKIINLASCLSRSKEADNEALAASQKLFGLNDALTAELRNRIDGDVNQFAQSLGIDMTEEPGNEEQAHRALGERLSELGQLNLGSASLWQARNRDELQNAISQTLLLTFDIRNSLLFFYDEKNQQLSNYLLTGTGSKADFKIGLEAGRSLAGDALLAATVKDSEGRPLNVIDKQLVKYCHSEHLVCMPLIHEQRKLGVLVLGMGEPQRAGFTQRLALAKNLCSEIAKIIASGSYEVEESVGISKEQYQLKVREAVHEASNPLSIIRNYLEILRIKLGDEHGANESLSLIKNEIERVGNILVHLKDPSQAVEIDDDVDINQLIKDTAKIFSDSICLTNNTHIKLQLDARLKPSKLNSTALKQVLTNLIKNATEALPSGGEINILTEANISVSGANYHAITIQDNGPGFADNIRQQIFSPVSSLKGNGHSGLGLSIVKKLIDEMGGKIVCRSQSEATGGKGITGTQFQILLPQ